MRSLKLHVSVENNDSDVEGGEQMKPACNRRRLHQKRMNENEVLGGKKIQRNEKVSLSGGATRSAPCA